MIYEYLIKNRIENILNQHQSSYTNRYSIWKRRLNISEAFEKELIKHSGKKIRVLEVGCDQGYNTFMLLFQFSGKYDIFFTGSEISPNAVELANKVKDFKNIKNCEFNVQDANKLEFPDDHFDIVVCSEVIEHLQKPENAISEIHRVLKKDGLAILTTPNGGLSLQRKLFRFLNIIGFNILYKIKQMMENKVNESVIGSASKGLAEEHIGFGHISVKNFNEWKSIFMQTGFKSIHTTGTGGLLFGKPSLDRHRILFSILLVMDAFIDMIPLSYLWNECLLFELRK